MMSSEQTVVARLTPPGSSALATLAIRGPRALAMCEAMFRGRKPRALNSVASDRHLYGTFGAEVRDDVVLRVVRREPTAEVEVHCHGGPAMVDALVAALVERGAGRVDWREYLRRQGVSDVGIEAHEALAGCRTARAAAILLDQTTGALDAALAHIERTGDREAIERLLQWARFGSHLVHPWKILLFGRVNVGKSSLLNALAGYERAIVSPIPGATRDVLTASLAFDGWPVELIDGAGFRESADPLEAQGQAKLTEQLGQADLRILLLDTSQPITETDRVLRLRHRPDLVIGAKSDLLGPWSEAQLARLDASCSATTGAGLDELIETAMTRLVPHVPPAGVAVPFTPRQVQWLRGRLTPPDR